jgi:type II restriction enzyme
MQRLSAADLVREIANLDATRVYEYASGISKLRILNISKPEGPINFIRWDSRKTEAEGNTGSISTQQLARAALAFSNRPNYPIHFDRLFSAGGNSRSALETLLAFTPHFFICYPERVDIYTGETLSDLKHIMWCPEQTHLQGGLGRTDYRETITELELGVDFGNIGITPAMLGDEFDSIEAKRTHTQMQVALVEIGNALNFRTWIAREDQSIPIGETRLGHLDGVIRTLGDVDIFYNNVIKQAAASIDCIWFTADGNRVPAVIEVEHSTGVTSGLTRMLNFKEAIPAISTTFTIVAPNDLRSKVTREANKGAFRKLNSKYMPYSTVRELYGLIQRYSLSNVVDYTFINPFMESVVEE